MSVEKKTNGVRPLSSVLKTFEVLNTIGASNRPMKLAEISKQLGESRATIYQKLLTLVHAGWLDQLEDGRYRLSLHSVRVGQAALEQAGLGERSTHILQELVHAVHETASLAVISEQRVRIVTRIEAEVVVRAQVRVGTTMSLHNSSSGRALTAFAKPDYLELLKRNGAEIAAETLLETIRQQGFAISAGKDVPGVQSIAVPVFDAQGDCGFALSIVAPAERFDAKRYLPALRRAGEKLGALLKGEAV